MSDPQSQEAKSAGPARPLRYGVLTTSWPIARWEGLCLERLAAVEGAMPVVTVLACWPSKGPRPGYWRGGLLWRVTRIPRLLASDNQLFGPAAWPPVFDRLPRLESELEVVGRYSARLPAYEVAALAHLDLDFMVGFLGFHVLKGDILEVPRYGLWAHHHGDPEAYRGYPPGLWEIYDGAPTSGAMLQRLTEDLDAGVVLRRKWVPTIATSLSRNKAQLYELSVPWCAEVCRRVLTGDTAFLYAPPVTIAAPIRTAPTSFQAVRLGWVLVRNRWKARAAGRGR